MYYIVGILVILVIVLSVVCGRFWQQARTLGKRYAGITNIQGEVAAAQAKLDRSRQAQKDLEKENQERRSQFAQELKQSESKRDGLQKEISLLEENLEDISFGLYKPHFSF